MVWYGYFLESPNAPKYSKCIPPTFTNIKTVVIVQKIDLLQKYTESIFKPQDREPFVGPFFIA